MCMSVCMYGRAFVCNMSACRFVLQYVYMRMCILVHACLCVCVHLCLWACMLGSIYVLMFYVCVVISTCMYVFECLCKLLCTRVLL